MPNTQKTLQVGYQDYIRESVQLPNESIMFFEKAEPGQERYVYFTHHTRSLCQYSYRSPHDNELFRAVNPTLEECRQALAEWLKLHI